MTYQSILIVGNTSENFTIYLFGNQTTKIMYGLNKVERKELKELEEILVSDGVFDINKISTNPKKAIKLKKLYAKKKELMLATLN